MEEHQLNHVCFASSTFSMDSGPGQPALLIRQQARWPLPAHCTRTLLRLVSSVPTVCHHKPIKPEHSPLFLRSSPSSFPRDYAAFSTVLLCVSGHVLLHPDHHAFPCLTLKPTAFRAKHSFGQSLFKLCLFHGIQLK